MSIYREDRNYGFELYHGSWTVDDVSLAFRSGLPACATLLDAIRLLGRTLVFENPRARLDLRVRGETCEVVMYAATEFRPDRHVAFTDWHRTVSIVSLARRYLGPAWQPEEVGLQGPLKLTAAARDAYSRVRFSSRRPGTSFRFPAKALAAEAPPAALQATARGVKARPHAANPPSDEFGEGLIGALGQLLRPYLITSRPSLDFAADLAGVSARTLQRALQRHGTTYPRLLDRCRFQMAKTLMSDPNLKLIDVSLHVGFENQAHFTRAFRRHAGVSPTEFRRSLAS